MDSTVNKLVFLKKNGISVAEKTLGNGLNVKVIETPEGYLVNTNHPLTKQQYYEYMSQVHSYVRVIAKLGPVV